MSRWWTLALWVLCLIGWIGTALAVFLLLALRGLADVHPPISVVQMIPTAIPLLCLLALLTWALASIWRRAK